MFADFRDLVDNLPAHVTEDSLAQALLVGAVLTGIVLILNAGLFAAKGLWRGAKLTASALFSNPDSPPAEAKEIESEPLSERCLHLLRCLRDHRRWGTRTFMGRSEVYVYFPDSKQTDKSAIQPRLMAGPGRGEADNRGGGSAWLSSHHPDVFEPTIDLLEGFSTKEENALLDAIERMTEVVDENKRREAAGLAAVFPDEPQPEKTSGIWRDLQGRPIDLSKFLGHGSSWTPNWGWTTSTIKIDGKPVSPDGKTFDKDIQEKVDRIQKHMNELLARFDKT